ncbi:hypothetical protein BaRGS_00019881, partial [Batillaria attramentaria]
VLGVLLFLPAGVGLAGRANMSVGIDTTFVTKYRGQPCISASNDGNEKSPVAKGITQLQDFHVPPFVLIIGLVLIVALALLSIVLIILQCKRSGRRKRRNRAANRESLLSAKSDMAGCSSASKDLDLGVTTYRATRSFPTFAPGPVQGVVPPPGHSGAMRYQKGPP